MCGIVGAVAQRDVAEILLEGLKRLEYRGYDSSGLSIIDQNGKTNRIRKVGKVNKLQEAFNTSPLLGGVGIAHTRWATHGVANEINAHPHQYNGISVVHNGIIENYQDLKNELLEEGHIFTSDTDTEVFCHLVFKNLKSNSNLLSAVQASLKNLIGSYAIVIINDADPTVMIAARSGSPMVIGLGFGENFVASDQLALLPVTRKFIYLEDDDVAQLTKKEVLIFDKQGQKVNRPIIESDSNYDAGSRGKYRHYMLKEIFEQPTALANTLKDRINTHIADDAFGILAPEIFAKTQHVQIIACGTSYNAGLVAKYWLEKYTNVSCNVEVASEFRYRKSHVYPNSLLVTISQSGETADTLAALRLAKTIGYKATLAICNVPGSSLVRESDLIYLMNAGTEVGVASTKAFTVQLTSLLLLTIAIGKSHEMEPSLQEQIIKNLKMLPNIIDNCLDLEPVIANLAIDFADKNNALFLGRGSQYPIAIEGALKLKEISYIHAEAYAAGELKHGPLALIDASMPVIVVAPNNELLQKLKSNVEEVKARGGLMYVFADKQAGFTSNATMKVINIPHCESFLAPIIYSIPLQLLAYHVALIKGTDVDQPRNLAKSVTVE